MFVLSYECTKLWDIQDFEKIQKEIENTKQFCPNYNTSIINTWKILCDYLQPGKSADGSMALEIKISQEEIELSLSDQDAFAQLFYSGLCEVFGRKNVLSVTREEYGAHISCIGVVFPLDRRIANPDKFLHSIFQQQPNDSVKQVIEHWIHTKFHEIYVTGETDGDDETARGYLPALLNFRPEPYHREYDTILYQSIVDPETQIQTMIPYDRMNEITTKVITYFTVGPEKNYYERSQTPGTDITKEEFLHKVIEMVNRQYPEVVGNDMNTLMRRVERAIFQNYILEPLIDDDRISDIMVLSPDNIRVKIGGERYSCDVKFIDANDYFRFIRALATRNNLNLGESAIHVFSDITSNSNFRMRFNIVLPMINSVGFPYLHIRKIAKKKRDLNYLMKNGMLDQTLADYLIDRARNGNGLTFVGKGASGKTTLMNTLLDYIPYNRSALIIQESEELFSDTHPHMMVEHIIPDEKNRYDLQGLARNGLLTDLDYFIIGEVKGAEAKYFINAADTGHKCWCSVHSPSAKEGVDKLADYIMYETKYSKEEAMYMLKNLGTIVFMKQFKVEEIVEIVGYDHERSCLIFQEMFKRVH